MPPRKPPRHRRDPVQEHRSFRRTDSRIAIAGHPIHAMLVTFPIALCFSTFGADLLWWWTGDPFWPRAALWAAGVGFGFGILAGLAGTAELLLVPGIRIRAASWTHFILAVTLLSVLGANWGQRLQGAEAAVLPWGLLTSALAAGLTAMTGWHGGKLVFDYGLGTQSSPAAPAHGSASPRGDNS